MNEDQNTVELDEETEKKIRECDYSIIVVSKNYFNDPWAIAQYWYAVHLKKPLLVAIAKGVNLPMEYTQNAIIVGMEQYNPGNEKSIKKCADKLVEHYEEWRRKNIDGKYNIGYM